MSHEPEADRTVMLRDGEDGRYLRAYLDDQGRLHIDGHDVGPETAVVSTSGSYEWFQTIEADAIPQLLSVLDADEDAHVLDVLERNYRGSGSYELERRLRESDIEVQRFVW